MKYFCILLLIVVVACSKSSDKQPNDVVALSTNTSIVETPESNYTINALQNAISANDALLDYMTKDKYESTNDLMPKDIVLQLDDESKKIYVNFLFELLRNFCRTINQQNHNRELIRYAYDYLNETKLFEQLNITNKVSLSGELAHAITFDYMMKNSWPYDYNDVSNKLEMSFEIMNNLNNLVNQSEFPHYSYYFRYGDIHTKIKSYEKAKEYYLEMAKYANRPDTYQFAMERYATRGSDPDNIEEYKKSIFEFLKTADPQYDSYDDAVHSLADAISEINYDDVRKKILQEIEDKKIIDEGEQINYLNDNFNEYLENLKKSIIEEVNNLKRETTP